MIGALIRRQEVIIPRGQTRLLPGDHLIIFTLPEISGQLQHYFAAARENRTNTNRTRK